VHWVALHFDLSQFPVKDREKVKLSVSVVLIFAAIAPHCNYRRLGIRQILAAALAGLPFWMSTFTLVHHTKSFLSMQLSSGRRFQHSYLAQFTAITLAGWKFFAMISMFTFPITFPAIPSIIYGWLIAVCNKTGAYLDDKCRFSWSLLSRLQISVICSQIYYQSFRTIIEQG